MNRPLHKEQITVLGGIDVTLNRTVVMLRVGLTAELTPAEARQVAGLLVACAEAAEAMERAVCPGQRGADGD